jgi:hypothetical protein
MGTSSTERWRGGRGRRIARQAAGDVPASVGVPKQRAARIAHPAGSRGGFRGDQSRSSRARGRPQNAPIADARCRASSARRLGLSVLIGRRLPPNRGPSITARQAARGELSLAGWPGQEPDRGTHSKAPLRPGRVRPSASSVRQRWRVPRMTARENAAAGRGGQYDDYSRHARAMSAISERRHASIRGYAAIDPEPPSAGKLFCVARFLIRSPYLRWLAAPPGFQGRAPWPSCG